MARVAYIYSDELISQCDILPAVLGRASVVHNLISSYDLLKHVQVVNAKPATYNDLREFHSELYLDHIKTIKSIDEDYCTNSVDEEYGLGYDCPPVSNMMELVSTLAGGSMTAANALILGVADIAINWCGGWHHASRFGAEGFCYVNDIVLAIERLRKKFPKVLYIDLDVHHGNGVEDAYNISKTVFTLSFHKHEPGFYPGSGAVADVGGLVGKGYCCNVPLHASYGDETMEYVFERVFSGVYGAFGPDAIVVQCGGDALAMDPHGGANLTEKAYCACLRLVLDRRKPTMLLGGGGYNHANTARLWASITASMAGVTLDEDIPDHEHWLQYGPDYTVHVQPTLARDLNKRSYLDECIAQIGENLKTYFGAKENEVDKLAGGDVKKIETSSNRVLENKC